MMQHHQESISRRLLKCTETFPSVETAQIVTDAEARICCLAQHVVSIARAAVEGVAYIENMLWKQVVSAIGKVVSVSDMTQYMASHNRKLYNKVYAPRPFCYDIRRAPGYSPEGTLSMEMSSGKGKEPISTSVRVLPVDVAPPMHFALNAATSVSFEGEHRLHGLMVHRVSSEGMPSITLKVCARQFSSFILLVGRIAAADLFEPSHAIVVKDKDEVLLPLLLDPLPTPGEFRDAISSLSPEQQRFAKAFRAMQLESTLFACCVVQIKPQLELLLRLPQGALTKEIMLTQHLMELFIEYQVCVRVEFFFLN